MKFTAIAFLASAALAQQQPFSGMRMQNAVPSVPSANIAQQQPVPEGSEQPTTPVPPAANVAQQPEFPSMQPNILIPNVETTERMPSALARLASFFDFSHISSESTFTPVIVTHVYDPAMRKFTHLSYNVVQNGDAYYVPVCSVDSIVQAGSSAIPASDSCQYGIQLAPVPRNAASLMLRAMRMALRLLARASSPLSIFTDGGQPGASMATFGSQLQD